MTFDPAPDQAPQNLPAPQQQAGPGHQPPGQPPAEWGWARPAPQPQWVETPPLAYHQLYRGVARYRWWKPLIALILAFLYYLTFSVVFSLAVLLPYLAITGDGGFDPELIFEFAIPDTQNPMSIFFALGSIALMIPAAQLGMLSAGLTPSKRMWSVALRIRWRLIGRTALQALVALIVINVVGIALEILFAGGLDSALDADASATVLPELNMTAVAWSLLLVVLLVPLQATAEEVVFRGMFMQSLGAWLGGVRGRSGFAAFVRGPWLPILVPAIAFGFSHIYDIWGWSTVVAMAVVAGWISWRTGGLEAAISLHVINNLIAFGFMSFGAGGETSQTESGGGPGSLIGALVGFALFAWWVDRDFKRRDGRRERIDYVQVMVR